jgi:hypothetical protein
MECRRYTIRLHASRFAFEASIAIKACQSSFAQAAKGKVFEAISKCYRTGSSPDPPAVLRARFSVAKTDQAM